MIKKYPKLALFFNFSILILFFNFITALQTHSPDLRVPVSAMRPIKVIEKIVSLLLKYGNYKNYKSYKNYDVPMSTTDLPIKEHH